jgi:hypothetical protein
MFLLIVHTFEKPWKLRNFKGYRQRQEAKIISENRLWKLNFPPG